MRALEAPWVCVLDTKLLSFIPRGDRRGETWLCSSMGLLRASCLPPKGQEPPCNKSSPVQDNIGQLQGRKKEKMEIIQRSKDEFWMDQGHPGQLGILSPHFPRGLWGRSSSSQDMPPTPLSPQLVVDGVLPICWTGNSFHHQQHICEPQLEPRALWRL